MDPRIRIRTRMPRIPNTALHSALYDFQKTFWFIQQICSEAGKEEKVKSPPGVEEERSASKRRRNSSSASSHNPAQGKQK